MKSSASLSSKLIAETIALGPAQLLKARGFRKQGRHFFRHTEAATCHLDVQASQWNAPDRVSFTVNLWSYLPIIATAKGETPIVEPLKQSRHAHCGARIGHLLPKPGDFWWCIRSPEEVPGVAAHLCSTIERVAIPYLERAATLSGVAELSGHIPGICSDPTEPKAIALRLLGQEREAAAVEAALKVIAQAHAERLQERLAKNMAAG